MGGPGSGRKKGSGGVNGVTGKSKSKLPGAPKKVSGKLMIKKAQIRYKKANSKYDSSINALNGKYGATSQRRALGYK